MIHREIKIETIGLTVWKCSRNTFIRGNVCLPDDKWEWWDARLGWRDELGLSLAFNKRFASSLPPEDVLDSTSLTPLSAGLAGSDPLPVYPRWNRNARVSFGNCVQVNDHEGKNARRATFCTLTRLLLSHPSFPVAPIRSSPKGRFLVESRNEGWEFNFQLGLRVLSVRGN